MNYDLGKRVQNSNPTTDNANRIRATGNRYSAAYQDQKPSGQKLSTYKSTSTDNLKRQGVGVTKVGVTSPSITNNYTGGASKNLYPITIVNKARAKLGGF